MQHPMFTLLFPIYRISYYYAYAFVFQCIVSWRQVHISESRYKFSEYASTLLAIHLRPFGFGASIGGFAVGGLWLFPLPGIDLK